MGRSESRGVLLRPQELAEAPGGRSEASEMGPSSNLGLCCLLRRWCWGCTVYLVRAEASEKEVQRLCNQSEWGSHWPSGLTRRREDWVVGTMRGVLALERNAWLRSCCQSRMLSSEGLGWEGHILDVCGDRETCQASMAMCLPSAETISESHVTSLRALKQEKDRVHDALVTLSARSRNWSEAAARRCRMRS
eukprot:scaffold11319_cov78-Cylindrotheca_fusiformis.AAC.2